MAGKTYSIKRNRIKDAVLEGFIPQGDSLVADESVYRNTVIFSPIDSGKKDSKWGRFAVKAQMETNMLITVFAFAVNIKLPEEKVSDIEFFRRDSVQCTKGMKDVLLYSLEGRYLYLAITIEETGSCVLENMKVYQHGDTFMEELPEIYRDRNSFIHRYMSIFSTVHGEFQDEIDELDKILDLDTCPVELLPVYASWMGIEISSKFLPEETLRTFVKELYTLTGYKGTRYALERVFQIILGEDVRIIENQNINFTDDNIIEGLPYGNAERGPFDVDVLVRKRLSETMYQQLLFLANQFVPARTVLHIDVLGESSVMDSGSYLDMNANLPEDKAVVLDENVGISDRIKLQ